MPGWRMPGCAVAMVWLKWGELTSVGVLALILAAYFYILYINRERMARDFAFWIEKQSKTN